mmetsp:Transcript_53315/g.64221  ORF Transcript_53315/g.64221 Transcript_53315/m.64221 type:complete len:248 (-) Transcript_53315:1113-1856(-)
MGALGDTRLARSTTTIFIAEMAPVVRDWRISSVRTSPLHNGPPFLGVDCFSNRITVIGFAFLGLRFLAEVVLLPVVLVVVLEDVGGCFLGVVTSPSAGVLSVLRESASSAASVTSGRVSFNLAPFPGSTASSLKSTYETFNPRASAMVTITWVSACGNGSGYVTPPPVSIESKSCATSTYRSSMAMGNTGVLAALLLPFSLVASRNSIMPEPFWCSFTTTPRTLVTRILVVTIVRLGRMAIRCARSC